MEPPRGLAGSGTRVSPGLERPRGRSPSSTSRVPPETGSGSAVRMWGARVILTVFGEPGGEGRAGKAVTWPDKEATDTRRVQAARWPGYGGGAKSTTSRLEGPSRDETLAAWGSRGRRRAARRASAAAPFPLGLRSCVRPEGAFSVFP